MIRIAIADDHEIVRKGLIQIITDSPNMEVIAEAANGQDLLEKVRRITCDVVLLDIAMPGRSGLEILKQLRTEKPAIPVLVLSIHPEEQYAVRTLKAGASGYLTKETASDKLIDAIKRVHEGGKYVSGSLAEKLASSLGDDMEKPRHDNLTDREYQVLRMIASGKTISEIAREVFLSVKTISTYRRRIMEKMKMKTNAEITHYAIKNNLLD